VASAEEEDPVAVEGDDEGSAVLLKRLKGRDMSTKHNSSYRVFAASVTALTLCLSVPDNSAAQQASPISPIGKSTASGSLAPTQKSFATAKEAAQALLAAAQADDVAALLLLFGQSGQEIITSGDPVQDKNHRALFVDHAKSSLKLQHDSKNPNRVVILLGEDDYPFAIPIIKNDGRWRFDTRRGKLEVLARRIGSNELDAMGACSAFVGAQYEYASEDHNSNGVREYAQRLISSPGTKDGLFWPASTDDSESPIAAQVTKAIAEGYAKTGDKPVPYHGYYFRILKSQGREAPGGAKDYLVRGMMIGGFGLVAWPAEYAVSGIKTFMVNQDGVIYQRDLGTHTAKVVQSIVTFNPDKTWQPLR
jgi:hypothetical protein